MKGFILTGGPVWRRRILLGLVVGVPVLFLRMVEDPFNVPKLALLIAGTAVVGAIRIVEALQGNARFYGRPLLVPAVAFTAVLVVSWIFSPYRYYALFGLYGRFHGLIPYLVIIVFGLLLADAFAGRARDLAWAFVVAGGFVGGYAMVQWVGADPFTWAFAGRRTTQALSTIGNPNFSGGFLGIVIPLGVGLWFVDKQRRRKIAVLTALMAGGCYVAYSQGGWAAAAAGSAVTLGFVLAPRFRHARKAGAVAALLVALFLSGGVVYTIMTGKIEPFPFTVASRGWWWEAAMGVAGDSPLVGSGPDTFYVEGVQHRPLEDALFWNFNFADDPHSVFFAFLSNAGVVGLSGYLVVLGWSIWRGLRLQTSNLVGAAFIGSVVAYFTQALISIDEVSLRLALWVGLAGLVASTEEAVPDPKPVRPGRKGRARVRPPPVRAKPAVIVVGLVTLGALWWSAMFLLADARVHQGNVLFAGGEVERGKRHYELGLSFRGDYEYRRRYARHLAQSGITEDAGADEFNRVMELLSFLDHFPQVDTLVERARAVTQRASVEPELLTRAAELYEEAFRIDPLNPVIRTEYARSLIAAEREDDAATVLEAFVAEMPKNQYPEFWGQLGLARALTGDSAAAREAIEIALTLDPGNSTAQRAQEVLERDLPS